MHRYTLEELELVDADVEPAFDNLTSLAAMTIDAPMSFVTMVQPQQNRQYFKSRLGVDVHHTPLSHSICQHVTTLNQTLVVNNANLHALVASNPAIKDLGIQAYLGSPIVDPLGTPIGALCVIDTAPRQWSTKDIDTLEALARCASNAVLLKHEMKYAEALQQEQREFACAVTHDMTAPLITVSSVLDNLATQYADTFSPQTHRLVQLTQETIDRARRMITEVAKYSKSANFDFDPEAVDLTVLLSDTRATLAGELKKSGASLVVQHLPTLQGNRVQLGMLFQNLLSNAIKFHKPGLPPHITVEAREHDDSVEIRVRDRGIGIAAKHQAQVFKLFSRLHGTNEYDGSGVGLTLAHRVVSNHNGSINIDSDGSNGTTIVLTLPKHFVSPLKQTA